MGHKQCILKKCETNYIPLTGILIAGDMTGVIVDSKYVKGGYIAVATLKDRDDLLSVETYEEHSVIVEGSLVYVAEDKTTYRYEIHKCEEEEVGKWVNADFDYRRIYGELIKAQTAIKELNENVETINNEIVDINSNYEQLLAKLNSLTGEQITCNLEEATVVDVGKLPAGTIIKGFTYDQIIAAMVYGINNPTMTDPSFSVVLNDNIGIAGTPLTVTGIMTFDRGTIDPAYGTSGYRAGLPVYYVYNGQTENSEETSFEFSFDIDELAIGDNSTMFGVYYSEGEQPLTSIGTNYDSPYPEGSLSLIKSIYGITPAFTGLSANNLNEVELTSATYFDDVNAGNGAGYYVTVAEASGTSNDCQAVAIPAIYTLYGIKVWDSLQNMYVWLYGSAEASLGAFPLIGTVTQTINGVSIEYSVYESSEDTEPYPIGSRDLQFFIIAPND